MRLGVCVLAVGCVLGGVYGKDTPVKVSEKYGFDAADATRFITAAINGPDRTVIIDAQPTPWYVTPLRFTNLCDKVIIFEKGTKVHAKPGDPAYRDIQARVFLFLGGTNVVISGYGAEIRMERDRYAKPPYPKSEHRHCIDLRGVTNWRVEGLTLAESGGDGIITGVNRPVPQTSDPCVDVTLKDLVCDRNFRQGLSVISVSNLYVKGCVFSNTAGTAPQSGVDIEPNHSNEVLYNITFEDCRFLNNQGRGAEYYIGRLNEKSVPVVGRFINCAFIGNRMSGFEYQQNHTWHAQYPAGGTVLLENCLIASNGFHGVEIRDKGAVSAALTFRNCRLVANGTADPARAEIKFETRFKDTLPTDGVHFENVVVVPDSATRPLVSYPVLKDYSNAGVQAITGALTVEKGGTREQFVFDEAWRTARTRPVAGGATRPHVPAPLGPVADPLDGAMRDYRKVYLEGSQLVRFYVPKPMTVRFRLSNHRFAGPEAKPRMLGIRTHTGGSKITVCNVKGDPKYNGFDKPYEVEWRATRAGWYALGMMMHKNAITVEAGNVPAAVFDVDKAVKIALEKGETYEVSFDADAPFSLLASPLSPVGNIQMELIAPDGRTVWTPTIGPDGDRYQGEKTGTWKLRYWGVGGCKYLALDLSGVPGLLWISR